MAAASLIGFGLVVITVSMLTSLLLSGALVRFAKRLHEVGPRAGRRAATLAVILPPLIGVIVSGTIAASSLLAYFAGQDHCLGHGHHLHLCPIHGAQWLSEPWAVAAMAFFGTFVIVRLGQTVWGHVSAQRLARRLRLVGEPIGHYEHTFIVPSDERFAFTAGVFTPTVIISRAAWDALDVSQRQAVLAHEHAHVRNGDLWKRAILGLLACFGAPILIQNALKLWDIASERVSDHEAARQVGKPSVVASAILRLARTRTTNQVPAVAVFAAACHVEGRIHSLFDHPESGSHAAKKLLIVLVLGVGAVALAVASFSESLHHLLETILG